MEKRSDGVMEWGSGEKRSNGKRKIHKNRGLLGWGQIKTAMPLQEGCKGIAGVGLSRN